MIKLVLYVCIVTIILELIIDIATIYAFIKNRKVLFSIWTINAIKINGIEKTCFVTIMLILNTFKLVDFKICEN